MLTKNDIPTPALLVDLDAFDANLLRMAEHARHSGKQFRPHAKAHKCIEIAKRQLAAGACGICVATLSEAELMANSGISGLLLTSPVADPRKMGSIVQTGAMVVVDHIKQVEGYEEAARKAGRIVDVLIDLDVGDHRTGAIPGPQAFEIAKAVDNASHLNLRGIQAYSVRGSHGASLEERRRISQEVFRMAAETRDAMVRSGLNCEIVSGGSTGTWDVDGSIADLTELQCGSYTLMDLAYRKIGIDFRNALTVVTTVISANHDAFVTVDGGFKAFSTDRGYGPEAVDAVGSTYAWGGDEFGFLHVEKCERKPNLGDRIAFIPPHCDPTVNLYDRIHACRGDRVEEIWPVKRAAL